MQSASVGGAGETGEGRGRQATVSAVMKAICQAGWGPGLPPLPLTGFLGEPDFNPDAPNSAWFCGERPQIVKTSALSAPLPGLRGPGSQTPLRICRGFVSRVSRAAMEDVVFFLTASLSEERLSSVPQSELNLETLLQRPDRARHHTEGSTERVLPSV
uniref:Uncharacterized protein n=1 Tax=Knipowitschia caucasica TaxID=637954 RepID=A0AAV2MED4_KNICA